MKTTIYANYGCLGEKTGTVYTVGNGFDRATCNEAMVVDLPDNLNWYTSINGDLCAEIDGQAYALRELLANDYRRGGHDAPALKWFDGQHHTIRLQIAE